MHNTSINLVNFQIFNKENNPVYYIQNNYKISIVIYIPKSVAKNLSQQTNYIYLTILDEKKAPVYQAYSTLPKKTTSSMYSINYSLVLPKYNQSNLNLQLALTNKHNAKSELSQSLHDGCFFNTVIPTKLPEK